MTTLKQVEANRRNAARSTGPKSRDGKDRSRRNALDHGLAGQVLVPANLEAAVAEKRAGFSVVWNATTELDHWHLEQVAIASVRLEEAFTQQESLTSEQSHRAELFWEDDCTLEASKLLDKIAKKPEIIARELELTTQGCDLMIARWESLQEVLVKSGQPWNEFHRGMALDLLGVGLAFREFSHADIDTVESQSDLANGEIARLRARQDDRLDARDAACRERAILGFAFPTREIWRLRRYEQAAHRAFHFSVRYLDEHCAKSKLAAEKPNAVSPVPVSETPVRNETKPARIERPQTPEKLSTAPKPSVENNVFADVCPSTDLSKPKGNAEYRKKMARKARMAEKAALNAK